MPLSPVEIRHITFPRRPLGYKRSAVERALTEVAESFEQVWRDRADLADKVEQLESDLARYRELESLLHATLVTAERTAGELKEQAHREADTVLAEAHAEARRIALDAHARHARLIADTNRVKALLESALAAIDEVGEGPADADRQEWSGADERAA